MSPIAENLMKEISVLKICRKMQKQLCGPDARGPIPHMGAFGKLTINNSTTNVPEKINLEYFIMKRYSQTLDSFMVSQNKQNNSISNILTIVDQLV